MRNHPESPVRLILGVRLRWYTREGERPNYHRVNLHRPFDRARGYPLNHHLDRSPHDHAPHGRTPPPVPTATPQSLHPNHRYPRTARTQNQRTATGETPTQPPPVARLASTGRRLLGTVGVATGAPPAPRVGVDQHGRSDRSRGGAAAGVRQRWSSTASVELPTDHEYGTQQPTPPHPHSTVEAAAVTAPTAAAADGADDSPRQRGTPSHRHQQRPAARHCAGYRGRHVTRASRARRDRQQRQQRQQLCGRRVRAARRITQTATTPTSPKQQRWRRQRHGWFDTTRPTAHKPPLLDQTPCTPRALGPCARVRLGGSRGLR